MKRNIRIQIVNPAGNITIFVLDRFPRSRYREIAAALLANNDYDAEQVGFVTGEDSMEMCGLEFCGNASRSFALLKAMEHHVQGKAHLQVHVSGMTKPAEVDVDTLQKTAKIRMPDPLSVTTYTGSSLPEAEGGTLVNLGGIVHLVLPGISANEALFHRLRQEIYRRMDPPAFGVMFLDTATYTLTPVVYVRDVDTVYFEGSCGSGTTAAAIALVSKLEDGIHTRDFVQPAGTLTASVTKKDGLVTAVHINSPISFSPVLEVEVDV